MSIPAPAVHVCFMYAVQVMIAKVPKVLCSVHLLRPPSENPRGPCLLYTTLGNQRDVQGTYLFSW